MARLGRGIAARPLTRRAIPVDMQWTFDRDTEQWNAFALTLETSTTQVHGGLRSLKGTAVATTTGGPVSPLVFIEPELTYAVDMWGYKANGTTTFQTRLTYYKANQVTKATGGTNEISSAVWGTLNTWEQSPALSLAAPSDAVYAKVTIITVVTNGDVMYFDDGALVASAPPITATQTDPVGITDAVSTELTLGVILTDVVGLVDSGSSYLGQPEPVGLTDSVSVEKSQERIITDLVGITDAVVVLLVFNLTLTDLVGLSDSATAVQTAARGPPDEPLGITDSLASTVSLFLTVGDPLGLTDSISASVSQNVVLTDPIGLLDAASRVSASDRTQTDVVGILDSASPVTTLVRTQTDGVGLVDSIAATRTIDVTVTDSVGAADSVTRVATLERSQTDNIGLLDTVADADVADRPFLELLGITDSVAVVVSLNLTLTDLAGLLDSTTIASTTNAVIRSVRLVASGVLV